jgi:hypothetical protein
VHVHRLPTTRFGRSGLAGRAIDYSCCYGLMWHRARALAERGDILLTSVVAWRVAAQRQARLVNWLQDDYRKPPRSSGSRLCTALPCARCAACVIARFRAPWSKGSMAPRCPSLLASSYAVSPCPGASARKKRVLSIFDQYKPRDLINVSARAKDIVTPTKVTVNVNANNGRKALQVAIWQTQDAKFDIVYLSQQRLDSLLTLDALNIVLAIARQDLYYKPWIVA